MGMPSVDVKKAVRKSDIRIEEITNGVLRGRQNADKTGIDTTLAAISEQDILVTQTQRAHSANLKRGTPYGAEYTFRKTPGGNHVRLTKARILTHREVGDRSSRAEIAISDNGEGTQVIEQKGHATCWRGGVRQLRVKTVFLTDMYGQTGRLETQVHQGQATHLLDLADFFARAQALPQLQESHEVAMQLQGGKTRQLTVSVTKDSETATVLVTVSTATDELSIRYPLPIVSSDSKTAIIPNLADTIMNAVSNGKLPFVLYPYVFPGPIKEIQH
jgi:hypothetical protein